MTDADHRDPYRSFNFQVIIDGVLVAAFSEVSGLTAEGDALDHHKRSDEQSNQGKPIGLHKYPTITLKRGYMQDRSLWIWYRNIINGQPDRRRVTIARMNEARQLVERWLAENVWVKKINGPDLVKYDGPDLNSASNEVAVESLELVHEGITSEDGCT